MSQRGDAYAIASAIYAGTKNQSIVDIDFLTDRLYTTVSNLGWGDDKAADVYARLAETLQCDTPFEKAVALIESAIVRAEIKYG